MSTERWSEWARTRKDLLNITNSQLADESEIPKGTIDRVLSGHAGDVRLSTMRAITKQLVGGTWGQYPCAAAEMLRNEVTEKTEKEMNDIRVFMQTSQSDHLREIETLKDDHKRKTDYLLAQNSDMKQTIKERDRRITMLASIVAALSIFIIAVLTYDFLNPTIGFLRY